MASKVPAIEPKNAPLVLVIRDGWGMNPNPSHDAFNAVKRARTPVADALQRGYPWTLIRTSGEDVGLPAGTIGNSEVGHQNIGAGRVVPQESLVMTRECAAGLHTNAALRAAILRCVVPASAASGGADSMTQAKATAAAVAQSHSGSNASGSSSALAQPPSLHLMGIASDAGVHGLLEHLYAILRACTTLGLHDRVYIHLFTDGRDTGPFTGAGYIGQIEAACANIGVGRIVSVCGRYYAMDRDHRWERVRLAYDCLTGRSLGAGGSDPPRVFGDAGAGLRHAYDHPAAPNLAGDEFVPPTVVAHNADDAARTRIRSGDSVVFYNYRGDRPREISAAFCFPEEKWARVKPSPDSGAIGFDRGPKLDLHYVVMTEYWQELMPFVQGVAFPKPAKMADIAGQHLSALGLRQLRVAETEKYPHVTFFFNDYRDEPFPGESRENPQSPRVATYDLKPEMACAEVRDAVLRALASTDCPEFIVVNFANPDMVGHTGNLNAAVAACEAVDACVGAIVERALARGGCLIVTADHGNAEQMFDPDTGCAHTAHTLYDVPCVVVGREFSSRALRGDRDAAGWFDAAVRARRGRLADIIPTALDMLGLPKPAAMTGMSLLV